MKYLLSILCIFPSILLAQQKLQVSESQTVFMEKVIQAPEFTKQQLYEIALDWVSETFSSAKDVITFKDYSLGKIKGTFYEDYQIEITTDTYSNTFEILIKEGRLKIKFDNIWELHYGYPIETNILRRRNNTLRKYGGLTADVTRTLNNLINNFETFIKNYNSKDNDW